MKIRLNVYRIKRNENFCTFVMSATRENYCISLGLT